MAVPESCPPVPVARNTMRLVAQTVVQAEGVHRGVVGLFRQSSKKDFLLAKGTSLALACPNEDGELLTQHTQPVHGTILDLKLMHAPQHANSEQATDQAVLLTTSGNLSIIQFETQLNRFVAHKHIPLMPTGMPNLLPPQSLQVDPSSKAIAVAGFNWLALLPTAATGPPSAQDAPVLAVLPSFYSSGQNPPKQKPPTPTNTTETPAATATAATADPLPGKTYASDEAWLRAQTESRRLEATWMTSDMASIPEVMQFQQDQMQEHASPASLPPSGLIRSICFVDIPDCGDSLCLAVLYYVAPDSGFTLDILQWAPGSFNLSVKLRLQLHELAEMHSFLLGCLVLDMSTIPTCESGLVLMYESGLVLLDLSDIVNETLRTSDGAPMPKARLRCHTFPKGAEHSSVAHMGVVFASRWPNGQFAAAPRLTASPDRPHASAAGSAGYCEAHFGQDHEQEEMVIEYLMASPRLLTSWCWRQKVFPAFSASAPRTDASKEVHQELLMGFDVSNNHKHSVLSMVVKRQHEGGQQASVWSVDLQDTGFSPRSSPTTMLSLPNQHIMFGSETGDGCVVKMPGPLRRNRGASGLAVVLTPSVTSVLHNAAPVWTFTVANLQHLPQDQVYAACGYSNNGSIRVIQADQTVETLYESGADYPGISGMWSLPPWPGAEFHSLLVLSFASGSRAMATGSTLRDVTEAVGLVANERSLLCACLADRLLVQVMHKRMQLCSMEAVLAPDQGELSCSPSGDRSRARLGEHLTLADLEISSPEELMQDGQHQRQEEERPAGAHAPTPAVPTPGSPGPVPLACDGGGYGYGMSQVVRGSEDVWMPPGGASISTAAAAEGVVVASCTHFKGLIAVQAVLCDEGSGGRSWGAGGVAQSPGKRKRTRKRWCLQNMAQAPLQDEVSCIHLLPYPQGGRGCKLVAAGTYKPDVQLLLLQAGDAQKSSPHQPRFLPLALIAISPLLQSAFQGAFFVPEEPPGSPRKELPDQAIPESVQILPVESQPADVQVLVGLRNGTMLQLTAPSHMLAAAQAPQLRLPFPQLQLTAIKDLGSLPVVLVPLPTAVGLVGTSLALSDRIALLASASGTGRTVASPLAVAGVTHVVPLWQPVSSVSGNTVSRFTVLCASSSGRLQLLDLQHQEHPHMRSLPLLPPARPVHMALHPTKPILVVACQGADGIWELRCIHPVSGATMARFPMPAGECITSLCMWDLPVVRPQPQTVQDELRQEEEEGEANFMQGVRESKPELPPAFDPDCLDILRLQDKERGIASDYLTPGYVVKDRVVAVVGTGEERAQKAGGGWTPCKGRLLLIQIQANQTGAWLRTVAESKLPDRVHAVAVLPGSAPAVGLPEDGTLVAAIGRRLVAFSERHGHLVKHHLNATAQPVTCLSPNPSIKGRFVASNELDSAMVYDCKPDSGFHMLQADFHSSPVSHCSAIQDLLPSQASVAAVDRKGRALFLAPEPDTFGPEHNMYTAALFHLGQAPSGIVQGNLRQMHRDETAGPETRRVGRSSSSMTEQQNLLPSSALPAAEIDPRAAGEGSGVGMSADSPQTSGQPQGSMSGIAFTAPASKGHSWVTATTAGQVIQLASLSEHQHQLLAALQHVMARHPAIAPLSGCHLSEYRAAQEKPQHRRPCQAEGPHIVLDGDMLSQFLYLPTELQKQLLSSLQAQLVLRRAADPNCVGPHISVSLPNIIQVLESTLPIC